ncbi:MAG TPA: AlkA N-terminal domain-containing protein [Polyangiaceae bacterium]|jgi:AraC family transcriptional regulator of adaptative response / DNA-3-methyladenine glycosylase II|nr:AlkA N-terminal domain-containing protein [Polyangiaceae bacterium]
MDLDADACYRAFQTRDARFDGRCFSGVLSTGIYCRPVCPARTPKRENMVFFPSAAAAQEAGFRPCLRCRPETSPDLGAWHGTSNTVARALALIEEGALDGGDVEALAERLGIGDRQLRRLFQQHLGASPIAVAQTRRVLLAKQLLHETRLTMSEVALASGFGSVRRFNETFQQLFARPPAALRRLGAAPQSKSDGVIVRLTYRPPYDWESLLAFLSARAIPRVEIVEGNRYARTIEFDGAQGTITVVPDAKHRLRATVHFPNLRALPAIIARMRRLFDLAADPLAIGAHLSTDSMLAAFVAERPGLRVPGAWDGFELAIRAILGQQITVPAATRLSGRLAELVGEPLLHPSLEEPALDRLFPTPEAVAASDLAMLGMPRARRDTLRALANAVVEDRALLSPGKRLEDAIARLRAVRGIGEWTAQYIAMRQLREPDAFPAADVGLLRAAAAAGLNHATPASLIERAEAWRPWRAYAAVHLWASSHVEPMEKTHDRHVA